LLKAGAGINAPSADGSTPLHYAAFEGDRQLLEFLLSAGASVNASNHDGWTPLHFVVAIPWSQGFPWVIKERTECAKLLIDAGADTSARSKSGKTPADMVSRLEEFEARRE
jgi:ankyrin repeat protein